MKKMVIAICGMKDLDVGGWQWKEGRVESIDMPWTHRIFRCNLGNLTFRSRCKMVHVISCDGLILLMVWFCGVANIDESNNACAWTGSRNVTKACDVIVSIHTK